MLWLFSASSAVCLTKVKGLAFWQAQWRHWEFCQYNWNENLAYWWQWIKSIYVIIFPSSYVTSIECNGHLKNFILNLEVGKHQNVPECLDFSGSKRMISSYTQGSTLKQNVSIFLFISSMRVFFNFLKPLKSDFLANFVMRKESSHKRRTRFSD